MVTFRLATRCFIQISISCVAALPGCSLTALPVTGRRGALKAMQGQHRYLFQSSRDFSLLQLDIERETCSSHSQYITNEDWQLGRHLQHGAGCAGPWSSAAGACPSVGCSPAGEGTVCREICCGSCCSPLAQVLQPLSSASCAQQHPCSSPCSFSKVVASSGMSTANPRPPHLHARSAQSLCAPQFCPLAVVGSPVLTCSGA